MERVAVGSADLVAVDSNGAGGLDRAYVRIRWSAAYAKGAQPMPSTNVLVLLRQAGLATTVGLSSDRCRGCGAPLVTATDSPKCDYCGAELAAGKQDWVLDEIAAPTAIVRTGRRLKSIAPPPPVAGVAPAAFAMVPMMFPQMPMAPGGTPGFAPAPMGFAAPPVAPMRPQGFAPQMQPQPPAAFAPPVQPQAFAQPVAAPPAPAPAASGPAPAAQDDEGEGGPEVVPPWALPDMSSPQERGALLARMAVIAAADGVVTREERRLIKKCAKRWGVPFETVEPILSAGVASLQALQAPENPQRFMMGLVAAALVDGRVDRKERQLLDGVAHNMGLDPDVVPGLITAMTEWRNRQAGAA